MKDNIQLKFLFYIFIIAVIFYVAHYKLGLINIKTQEDKNNSNTMQQQNTSDPNPVRAQRKLELITSAGKHVYVNAEYATTAQDRALGLMYRSQLNEFDGMWFVFDTVTNSSFWMKNCKFPLDLIFADESKKIIYIVPSVPICTKDPCQLYAPMVSYKYVLEVNSGWANKNGIEVGDTIVE